MYSTHCSVAGCTKKTKRHTHLCSKHQKNQRRHGHPLQVPVSSFELRRYTRHVRGLINGRKNREAIWSSLLEALDVILREAASEVRRVSGSRGIARSSAYQVDHAIVTVCGEAQAEDVVVTLVSLGYLAAYNPKRFISDDAYHMAFALRFRRLAPSSFNRVFNPVTGAKGRVPQDFNPRSQLLLGHRLATAFAAFGMRLCELEAKENRERMEKTKAPIALLSEDKAA